MSWCRRGVRGVLLDITGVLYESGTTKAIPGSVEAVCRLREAGIGVRLVTNESSTPVTHLVTKLQAMGFQVCEAEVTSPIPAAIHLLAKERLIPHLLVSPEVVGEFAAACPAPSPARPASCVVVGDAGAAFTFPALNQAFRALHAMDTPRLIALGSGKYYRHEGELQLDLGGFVRALEYASGVEAEVVGKPSPAFFKAALSDLGVAAEEAVMVGDDIEGDVGGAAGCGVTGMLVRTGKFTPAWEHHPTVTPELIGDNLAAIVDVLLGERE